MRVTLPFSQVWHKMAMQKYGNDLGLHRKGIIICSCLDGFLTGKQDSSINTKNCQIFHFQNTL